MAEVTYSSHPSTPSPLLCHPRSSPLSVSLSVPAGQVEPEWPHTDQKQAAVLHMSRCENGRWGDGRCGHGHPQGTALHLPHQSPAERPGWSLAGRAADEQLLAWEHHHLTWLTSPFAINHRWTEAGWTRGEERSWAALLGLRWLPYRGAGGYGASSLPKHVSSTTLQHHSHETSSFILGFAIHSVVASVVVELGRESLVLPGYRWLVLVVGNGGWGEF